MPISEIYGPDDFAKPPQDRPASPARRLPGKCGPALPRPLLEWTPEVERATAHLYDRVKHVIPPIEWPLMAPTIKAINELKAQRNAVILAHNYQTPEIFHCVSDVVGDSLALAREAAKGDARVIVMAGVHFMAETAKLLNPSKTVLIPEPQAGRPPVSETVSPVSSTSCCCSMRRRKLGLCTLRPAIASTQRCNCSRVNTGGISSKTTGLYLILARTRAMPVARMRR